MEIPLQTLAKRYNVKSIIDLFNAVAEVSDLCVLDANNYSESTTEHKLSVPHGKRYIVLFGLVNRDQASTLAIYIMNRDNKILAQIGSQSSGTGVVNLCNFSPHSTSTPLYLLKEGDYLHFVFGSAQGTAGYINVRVLELNIGDLDD